MIAFDRIEPIGEVRADFAMAQLCHMFYQTNKKKNARDKTIADFMPFFIAPRRKMRTQITAQEASDLTKAALMPLVRE